jgi:nucleotide-binding universal stress UspA family protein
MFTRILLPLDGSALAETILPHALAVAHLADATLILLHVAEVRAGPRLVDPLEWQIQQAAVHTYLAQTCQRLRACGVQSEYLQDAGSSAERIIEQAKQLKVDLILMSSHGQHGSADMFPGSVAHKLVEHIGTSGMLVRVQAELSSTDVLAPARYGTILVPLDGSRRAECVLPIANRLATAQGAELVLAHVAHSPALLNWAVPRVSREERDLAEQLVRLNQSVAEQYLAQLQEYQEAPTTIAIAQGDNVAIELHHMAEQYHADLVLISAHGAGANPLRHFGDTLSNLLEYCRQPILVYQDRPDSQANNPEAAPQRERASVHMLESRR